MTWSDAARANASRAATRRWQDIRAGLRPHPKAGGWARGQRPPATPVDAAVAALGPGPWTATFVPFTTTQPSVISQVDVAPALWTRVERRADDRPLIHRFTLDAAASSRTTLVYRERAAPRTLATDLTKGRP